jgi:hypothetical protein
MVFEVNFITDIEHLEVLLQVQTVIGITIQAVKIQYGQCMDE